LLIWHSKYCAALSYRLFFGDFAHWEGLYVPEIYECYKYFENREFLFS